jgi:tetratricopeptide (TPR) repeat protein
MQFQTLTARIAVPAMVVALSFPVALRAQSLDEGVKMLQYERYESARRILTPLAATNPRASYYLGLAELGLENNAAAQAAFSKYADDAASLAGQAMLAYANGNKAEGDRLAALVAEKGKKKDVEPLKFAADAYLRGGDAQRAVDLYNKVLEKNDDNSTRVSLGDAYLKLPGGGGQAMSAYEKVTGKDAKNSLAFSRIGSVWYSAKRYDLALENYNKAKEADPSNPLPYRDLANAYFYTGKYENARKNIEEYLKYSDKTADDEVQYLNILYLGKDYPAAIQKANELINSGNKRAGLYGILGYSQMETKDAANALKNARTYLSIQKPERIFPSDYMNLGRIFLMNSQVDSASYYFNMAVAKDTARDKSETYRKIAEGLKDVKDYGRSAEWYGKLVNEYPASPAIDYFWAGAMLYYAKDYSKAGNMFERMETKYSDQPSATYWRGRVAAAIDQEGKAGTATQYYEKWLANPAEKKSADLMQAYQYLAISAYNRGDKAGTEQYLNKISAIEPENNFVKQIRAAQAKPGAKPKAK